MYTGTKIHPFCVGSIQSFFLLVGPSISPGPFNVTVTTGIRAVLGCETTGIPPPKVSWKRNGATLDTRQFPDRSIQVQTAPWLLSYNRTKCQNHNSNVSTLSRLLTSGSLVLLSPSNEDEGYFECTAVNEAGEERRVVEVILQGMINEI